MRPMLAGYVLIQQLSKQVVFVPAGANRGRWRCSRPMRLEKNSDLYQAHVLCCITSDSASSRPFTGSSMIPRWNPRPVIAPADTCSDVDPAVCRVPLIDSCGVA